MLVAQLRKNLAGVGGGALINFLGAVVFLSLSAEGYVGHAELLATVVVLFSILQILDAFRLPLIFLLGQCGNPEDSATVIFSSSIVLFVFGVAVCLGLFVLSMVPDLVSIVQLCAPLAFLCIINSGLWGIVDSYGEVAISSVAKAISNAAGFFALYLFSLRAPEYGMYALLVSPVVFFALLLLLVRRKRLLSKINVQAATIDVRVVKAFVRKLMGVLVNFIVSTAQGNYERIFAVVFAPQLLLATTVFSEISNRLSFFPRMIYNATYPLLVGRNQSKDYYGRVLTIFLITVGAIVVSTIILVNIGPFVLKVFFPTLVDQPYSMQLLVFFIVVSLFKLFSYTGALLLNVKGDFLSQPVFTLSAIVCSGLLAFLTMSSADVVWIMLGSAFLCRASDILFGVYAAARSKTIYGGSKCAG